MAYEMVPLFGLAIAGFMLLRAGDRVAAELRAARESIGKDVSSLKDEIRAAAAAQAAAETAPLADTGLSDGLRISGQSIVEEVKSLRCDLRATAIAQIAADLSCVRLASSSFQSAKEEEGVATLQWAADRIRSTGALERARKGGDADEVERVEAWLREISDREKQLEAARGTLKDLDPFSPENRERILGQAAELLDAADSAPPPPIFKMR